MKFSVLWFNHFIIRFTDWSDLMSEGICQMLCLWKSSSDPHFEDFGSRKLNFGGWQGVACWFSDCERCLCLKFTIGCLCVAGWVWWSWFVCAVAPPHPPKPDYSEHLNKFWDSAWRVFHLRGRILCDCACASILDLDLWAWFIDSTKYCCHNWWTMRMTTSCNVCACIKCACVCV